jgi:hypothetical protein
MEERICPNCHMSKPLTSEFWYYSNRIQGKFMYKCKNCKDEYLKEYYKDKPKPFMKEFHYKNWRVRYLKRLDIWRAFEQKPKWRIIGEFLTEEEARRWLKNH